MHIVRENYEGEYPDSGGRLYEGSEDESVIQLLARESNHLIRLGDVAENTLREARFKLIRIFRHQEIRNALFGFIQARSLRIGSGSAIEQVVKVFLP